MELAQTVLQPQQLLRGSYDISDEGSASGNFNNDGTKMFVTGSGEMMIMNIH